MRSSDVLVLKKSKLVEHTHGIQLGTQTITEVKNESTDKDPGSIFNLFFDGTQTFTKTRGETSDSDK